MLNHCSSAIPDKDLQSSSMVLCSAHPSSAVPILNRCVPNWLGHLFLHRHALRDNTSLHLTSPVVLLSRSTGELVVEIDSRDDKMQALSR